SALEKFANAPSCTAYPPAVAVTVAVTGAVAGAVAGAVTDAVAGGRAGVLTGADSETVACANTGASGFGAVASSGCAVSPGRIASTSTTPLPLCAMPSLYAAA